jgi:hypothetical protein
MCILCGGACGGVAGTIAPIVGIGGAIVFTKVSTKVKSVFSRTSIVKVKSKQR